MDEESKKPLLLSIFTSRYRFFFGAVIFIFLLVGMLFLTWNVPGQINQQEKLSAINSATVSISDPSAKTIINLPYMLLQKAALHYFGVTTFAIKLPSFIIGFISGLGILLLLRSWLLRSSIALFSGVVAITSSQFMLAVSSGTPMIMFIFWTVVLLLFALKLSAHSSSLLWCASAGIVLALSLYTPLSIFLFLGLPVIILLHPHLRHVVRKMPKKNILVPSFLFLILIIPLGIALYKQPSLLSDLVGWPGSDTSLGTIKASVIELIKSYFYFWQPQLTPLSLTPIFGLGSFCLIVFGAIKLIVDHHSARSYSLAILLPLLLVPVLLEPKYAPILFVPFILLLAIGVEALLDEWYKLFPHNPYARVVALVPLTILLSCLVISNVSHYTNVMRYSTTLPTYYSQDLALIRPVLADNPNAIFIVAENDQQFYDLLRRDFPKLTVTGKINEIEKKRPIIVAANSNMATDTFSTPKRIVTSSYASNNPRFSVFINDK